MLDFDNYYTPQNRYLSNSKINDWFRDKHFFHRKHILGEIEAKESRPLLIGKAVDTLLIAGQAQFDKEFVVVKKKSPKTFFKPDVTELNEGEFEEISGMVQSLRESPAYQSLVTEGHTTQQILYKQMPIGQHFIGICGIPDFFLVKGNKCIITDLKTIADASPNKHHYHCLDYGYYRQMAMYSILIQHFSKKKLKFEYRHLLVEKDSDKLYKVYARRLAPARIDLERDNIIKNIIPAIAAETEFKKFSQDWSDAVEIGDIYDGN